MIVIYTSDLHGNKEHYLELFDLAMLMQAQAVIIGGDMLPIRGPFQSSIKAQEEFIFSFLEPALQDFLSASPQTMLYTMLGNDDWQTSNLHLRTLAEKGLLCLLHGERHELGDGYEIIGYCNVPPTPFTIKDSERRDLETDSHVSQRSTACLSQGDKVVVIDPSRYFADLPSIQEELRQLPAPADLSKTVYVMHAPPYGTKLDRLFDGRWIGSLAIRAFIDNHQPYLSLHGHIHESSEISGTYWDRIGETICINPGQSTEELYCVIFELEDIPGTIEHNVFGRPEQRRSGH